MPFDYYHRLSKRKQAIYRRSDAVDRVPLPDAAALHGPVEELREALEGGGRAITQAAAGDLVAELLLQLEVPRVHVEVLAHRPAISGGELHGLYEAEEGETPVITIWMRTAAQGRVVAFKTFLRTLLHEVVHHLDFEQLGLEESFHTQGFLRRESSLVKQLLAGAAAPAERPRPKPARGKKREGGNVASPEAGSPAQLDLPW